MINLKEIEKAIDELLNSETEESLNTWLKKQPVAQPYLGEGEFLLFNFKSQHIEIVSTAKIHYVSEDQESIYAGDCLYAMAA